MMEHNVLKLSQSLVSLVKSINHWDSQHVLRMFLTATHNSLKGQKDVGLCQGQNLFKEIMAWHHPA